MPTPCREATTVEPAKDCEEFLFFVKDCEEFLFFVKDCEEFLFFVKAAGFAGGRAAAVGHAAWRPVPPTAAPKRDTATYAAEGPACPRCCGDAVRPLKGMTIHLNLVLGLW